jgi:hypothetical protein
MKIPREKKRQIPMYWLPMAIKFGSSLKNPMNVLENNKPSKAKPAQLISAKLSPFPAALFAEVLSFAPNFLDNREFTPIEVPKLTEINKFWRGNERETAVKAVCP